MCRFDPKWGPKYTKVLGGTIEDVIRSTSKGFLRRSHTWGFSIGNQKSVFSKVQQLKKRVTEFLCRLPKDRTSYDKRLTFSFFFWSLQRFSFMSYTRYLRLYQKDNCRLRSQRTRCCEMKYNVVVSEVSS